MIDGSEEKLIAENVISLCIIAEHKSETAVPFMNKHCLKTTRAVLGG